MKLFAECSCLFLVPLLVLRVPQANQTIPDDVVDDEVEVDLVLDPLLVLLGWVRDTPARVLANS